MGGHGYSRYSMMGEIRNNNDINVTWDGANNVLIQQCSKYLLGNAKAIMTGKTLTIKVKNFFTNLIKSLLFMNKLLTVKEEKIDPKEFNLKNINCLRKLLEHNTNLLILKSLTKLSGKLEENSNDNIAIEKAQKALKFHEFTLETLNRKLTSLQK